MQNYISFLFSFFSFVIVLGIGRGPRSLFTITTLSVFLVFIGHKFGDLKVVAGRPLPLLLFRGMVRWWRWLNLPNHITVSRIGSKAGFNWRVVGDYIGGGL